MNRHASRRDSRSTRPLSLTLALGLALGGAAPAPMVRAQEAPISTAVVRIDPATTNITPAPPPAPAAPITVGEQIDRFLRETPNPSWSLLQVLAAVGEAPARSPQGEVGVAVGSGGYRSAYVSSMFPIGRNGVLSLSVGESRGGRGHGYLGGGYGLYGSTPFGLGAGRDFSTCRQSGGSRTSARRAAGNVFGRCADARSLDRPD